MKRAWIGAAAALLLVLFAAVGDEDKKKTDGKEAAWLTDFEAAKKAAEKADRLILADFSGSDWCGWCIKLDKEVFSQEAFKAYAEKNLILFLADFPSRKEIPAETKKQNEALARTYGVKGFPTVLLLDADGDVVAKTGYRRGGPDAYVEHLKELIQDSR
jgi:thioredoxin-related protein